MTVINFVLRVTLFLLQTSIGRKKGKLFASPANPIAAGQFLELDYCSNLKV